MTAHSSCRIAVYGAYGHTGRFVVAELRRRGFIPVACGRDAIRLQELATTTGSEIRVAAVDDPAALDATFAGTAAILHCAGPFLDTRRRHSTPRCVRASTISMSRRNSMPWQARSPAVPKRVPRA